MDAQYWDEKYRSTDQLFSGAPNAVLVAEVAELAPGNALDLGCGEGADAHWLARHGWRVTAVDIAPTALRRAAEAAPELADQVTWTAADITRTPPAPRTYDLVSAHYFPLPRTADHTALHGLLEAVAPGGTLLFTGHDLADLADHLEQEYTPHDFYQPAEVAALLGEEWTVLVDETRPRTTPPPPGTGHTHDTVLRARRRP
ncbi:class I SAM-dependent methyltransferase [Streptomyces albidoflavus]